MKKNLWFILPLLFSVLIVGCGSKSEDQQRTESSTNSPNEASAFTDNRDGHVYHTVKIGDQVWMVENLNLETSENSWCYSNYPKHCEKYGRLYTWSAAMMLPDSCQNESCIDQIQNPHQGLCPDGFHVPTENEFNKMLAVTGGKIRVAHNEDQFGFSLWEAGYYSFDLESFINLDREAYLWTSTEDYGPWVQHFSGNGISLHLLRAPKKAGEYVRCLKN